MRISLKIKPNQRFDRIEKLSDGWQVRVKAPAIDGKANEHLINFLSDVLKLSKSSIRIIKGPTSSFKTLEIDADEKAVIKRLEEALT